MVTVNIENYTEKSFGQRKPFSENGKISFLYFEYKFRSSGYTELVTDQQSTHWTTLVQ